MGKPDPIQSAVIGAVLAVLVAAVIAVLCLIPWS
jgi:hypothetical protein